MAAIIRTGRQRSALAAEPVRAADVLADPAAVTALLGDLIDQHHSTAGPPARWAVPGVRVAGRTIGATLAPHFHRDGTRVRIDAPSTAESSATARLVLDVDARPGRDGTGTELVTDWRLELGVAVPRAALLLAGPALDLTIERTVRHIMDRTVAAVDGLAP